MSESKKDETKDIDKETKESTKAKAEETKEDKEKVEAKEDLKKETKEEVKTSKTDEKPKKVKKSKEELLIESLKVDVSKYKKKIEELEKSRHEDHEKYKMAAADLENTRKRLENNVKEEKKYASLKLVSELIKPVDMLKKVTAMEATTDEMNNFLIGFKMIASQLDDILNADGLKEIEALNMPFDPNMHQAISTEKVEGVEPGMVIEVLQTGYKYKDRIIQPAMVKVSE